MEPNESTAVAVKNETDYPVCDPERGKRLAHVLQENMGNSSLRNLLPRITMPSGKGSDFIVPGINGDVSMKTMDVIIVGFQDHRVYFEKPFDETGGSEQPDCHSEDMEKGVGDPGGECAVCPWNEYESADKGKGKKCAEKRMLMLFLPGRSLPIKLDAPPTSLQNIHKYFLGLACEDKLFRSVVTTLSLEKDKSATGVEFAKIVVKYLRDLSADEIVCIEKYAELLKEQK